MATANARFVLKADAGERSEAQLADAAGPRCLFAVEGGGEDQNQAKGAEPYAQR